MKMTTKHVLTMAALLALGIYQTPAAEVVAFPLVKLAISGTVLANTNHPVDDGKTTGSSLTKLSINTKSLINLLNASSDVNEAVVLNTGKKRIPAGSYFVYDLAKEALIVSNKNGFSFPLQSAHYYAYYPSSTTNYSYGALTIDATHLVGSFSQNDTNSAGSESDLTGIYLRFNDSNGTVLSDYGNGTLKWTFGGVSAGVQKTFLQINFPVPNGFADFVKGYEAVAQNVKASGNASGDVVAGVFPFYLWW